MVREKEYIEFIKNNFDECRKSGMTIRKHLLSSPVAFHGRCVQTLHIPKIFETKDIENLKQMVDDFYNIFSKIINRFKTDESYRKLFPFSKELEELILTDCGYEILVPIMRMDIFYNEETGDYKFCEINTDGTSAMIEDYELSKAFAFNNLPIDKEKDLSSFELFDSWVQALSYIYSTFKNKRKRPNVVIADFLDKGYLPEFEEFLKRFKKYGYSAKICDIRKLCYKDSVLYDEDGERVDIIYRRAVTKDIMENIDDTEDFIKAYKDANVCCIGSFRTQIIHHKALFKIIQDEETYKFLEKSEIELIKNHIPYTKDLAKADEKDIIDNKDKYIIKPCDSYASKGVYAGIDYEKTKWEELIKEYKNTDYIVQEYQTPYKTQNIYFAENKAPEILDYSNLTGVYVYNGCFQGIYSRLSDGAVISSQYNEKAVASYVAVKKNLTKK